MCYVIPFFEGLAHKTSYKDVLIVLGEKARYSTLSTAARANINSGLTAFFLKNEYIDTISLIAVCR